MSKNNKLENHLPIGVEEFKLWAKDIIALAGLPQNESMEFALATIILELPKDKGCISKKEMAIYLVKAASNQVASYMFQSIKAKRMDEDAKKKANEEAQKLSIVSPTVLTDGA